ncbi:glycosyltransferase [Chloropicon primus]|uniref:Glycosyltransferase n=1 Tax=Chloropicon primus TaxID=1764295 RepID=A0A5B8MYD8_9CHLO|nr:glycosyltransferase [Chloropicon primus]|eukprot:QDZ25557.1 glycosyltransferase [Chloropicon primus]
MYVGSTKQRKRFFRPCRVLDGLCRLRSKTGPLLGKGKYSSSFLGGRNGWRRPWVRLVLAALAAYLVYTLALGVCNLWTYHHTIKYYPKVTNFKQVLGCTAERRLLHQSQGVELGAGEGAGALGVRPLGRKPQRGEDGRLRAATVTLLRTPENACEVSKILDWMREYRAAWPWLRDYDHIILHEADYVEACPRDLEEPFKGKGGAGRVRCVSVDNIPGAFKFPEGTEDNGFGVKYAFPSETRNLGYMHMCRLFSVLIFPYLEEELGYEYVLRMDDDNVPLSNGDGDLFEMLQAKDAIYGYPAELPEWHAETKETFGLWLLHSVFSPTGTKSYHRHVNEVYNRNQTALYNLANSIFFTNMFITRLSFWNQPHVRDFLGDIESSGNIYKHRWGDAPIHHVVLSLFADSCSVLDLCEVAYKHGSTGHVIADCGLKRVEVHKWDEEINPECKSKKKKRGQRKTKARKDVTSYSSNGSTVESGSVSSSTAKDFLGQANLRRCSKPVTDGKFIDLPTRPAMGGSATASKVFLPRMEDEECYYHRFSRDEAKTCMGSKWAVFAGGQNAFNTYASLVSTLVPGFFMKTAGGHQDNGYRIQFGQAYDLVIDSAKGSVVYFNQTFLDMDKSLFSRVYGCCGVKGNPHSTTKFTDKQMDAYKEFLEAAPALGPSSGGRGGLTRVTIVVGHYWSNAGDVMWLAGQQPTWREAGLMFYAQLPSFEINSMCMEDADYCWVPTEPTKEIEEERKEETHLDFINFIKNSRVACKRPGAQCFVMSALPSEAAVYGAMIEAVWGKVNMKDYPVHLIKTDEVLRKALGSSKETEHVYVMPSFATQWVLQMMYNTVCDNVLDYGSPQEFLYDRSCEAKPFLMDDYGLCDPIEVKHRRWPLPPRMTNTTFKESKCKTVLETCDLMKAH